MGINQCITLSSLKLVARILNWFPDDFFEKKGVSPKAQFEENKEFQTVTMQVGSKECCVLLSSSYGVKKIHKDIICKSIL